MKIGFLMLAIGMALYLGIIYFGNRAPSLYPQSFWEHPQIDEGTITIAQALCGPNPRPMLEYRNSQTEHVTYCCDHHRGFYPVDGKCDWPKRVSKSGG